MAKNVRKRNQPCPCGSGKKFKNCCKDNQNSTYIPSHVMKNLHDKFMRGELPFRAEIHSKDGTPGSMKVTSARIINGDGTEKLLFEDEVTLSTNSADGDTIPGSKAIFSVPVKDGEQAKIQTTGNASVNNTSKYCDIEIINNPKKLKVKSASGLFAVIRISTQRNDGFDFFDILFGSKGQSETKNSAGEKIRPHIAIFADGNGKFIRLSSFKCQLQYESIYDPQKKSITSSEIKINLPDYSEDLCLFFTYETSINKVILTNAEFKSK